MATMNMRQIHRHNLQTLREQPMSEISGALGDLGTFLPIVISMTVMDQISLPATLIFTGSYNILTGVIFGIPLPVQPMKAIAAVALLKSLSAGEVGAAGIFVASCILLFSVTGLLRWFTAVIPIPVVKGIQVGAGLSLIMSSGAKILSSLSWTGPSWSDNYIWAITAFTFLLSLNFLPPRTPYALLVFILGLIFATIQISHNTSPNLPTPNLWHPQQIITLPSSSAWSTGILSAGIGQLPLTTLNSIIAVHHLSTDLLPHLPAPTTTSLGLSVAAMNLFGIPFGAMPVCHGSGGLAAQYRFGARSGASIIILGLLKLLIGLLFGSSLLPLLKTFPTALLSIMVIAAGLELASVGESLNTDRARDIRSAAGSFQATGPPVKELLLLRSEEELDELERKRRWNVMMVTVGLLVAFRNDAVGFVAGMMCHWSYEVLGWVRRLRDRRQDGGLGSGGADGEEGQGLLRRGGDES